MRTHSELVRPTEMAEGFRIGARTADSIVDQSSQLTLVDGEMDLRGKSRLLDLEFYCLIEFAVQINLSLVVTSGVWVVM
jgi:hypothetical protein